MSEKPKPCPFCGAEAIVYHREDTEGADIRCSGRFCILCYGLDLWIDQDEAIRLWNKRTEATK